MIQLSRYEKYKKSYQAYYSLNKAIRKQYNHAYYLSNKVRINALHCQWNKDNSEKIKGYHKKHFAKQYESNKRWRLNNPKKVQAEHLLNNNPKKYPLDNECEFCGDTDNLEHGHVDYAYPEIYLTVCHGCNLSMDVKPT